MSLALTALLYSEYNTEEIVVDKKKAAIEAFKNKDQKPPEDGGAGEMIKKSCNSCIDSLKLKCCRVFVCILFIIDIAITVGMIVVHFLFCKVSFTTASQCETVEPKWLREMNN